MIFAFVFCDIEVSGLRFVGASHVVEPPLNIDAI